MINYIAQHAKVENVICVIDMPELTNEINDYLIQMHLSYNIIFTNKWNCSLDIEDILLFDYKVIDLYDENKIYNLGLSKGICTLEEVKDMLKEIINEEYVKSNKSIINKLKI
ncbi:MAG: hypothetical protein LUH02_09645, partial [Erysipelotrichaceae bacterium]|nr:hypothetical protein [Erysipelotrichaceae bacterium]